MIDFATKLGGSIDKQGIKKLTNNDSFLMMPATPVPQQSMQHYGLK